MPSSDNTDLPKPINKPKAEVEEPKTPDRHYTAPDGCEHIDEVGDEKPINKPK